MVDTIRVWDYVQGIEGAVRWRPRKAGSNDYVLRRWRGRSGPVRVFAIQRADGRVMVSAEASLPRLVSGDNEAQLSPEEVRLACEALHAHVLAALPCLSGAGPRRWRISRLDLSHDLTLPEGHTARDVARRLAQSLSERPYRGWLPMFDLEDPLWNTLRLTRHRRDGSPAKKQGVAYLAYDKGGKGGLPATNRLRIEARLRHKPLAGLVHGKFLLERLQGYLAQYGLVALRKGWDGAVQMRAASVLGQELAEAIRVPEFPERASEANRRWRNEAARIKVGRNRQA